MNNKQPYETPDLLLRPIVSDTTIAASLKSSDDNEFGFSDLL